MGTDMFEEVGDNADDLSANPFKDKHDDYELRNVKYKLKGRKSESL